MLIADVGEGAREEVDRLPLDRLGLNFGWPCKEGSIVPPKVDIPESCSGARLIPPLFEYPHGKKRCSITGGVVARAPSLRALDGLYLWADFCEGRVNALTAGGNVVPLNLHAGQRRASASTGRDGSTSPPPQARSSASTSETGPSGSSPRGRAALLEGHASDRTPRGRPGRT
jgi:hypothetical protein